MAAKTFDYGLQILDATMTEKKGDNYYSGEYLAFSFFKKKEKPTVVEFVICNYLDAIIFFLRRPTHNYTELRAQLVAHP